jgi:hypothetical protein
LTKNSLGNQLRSWPRSWATNGLRKWNVLLKIFRSVYLLQPFNAKFEELGWRHYITLLLEQT